MSVLHLCAVGIGEMCTVCVSVCVYVREGSYFVLQRRSTARLFSRKGTGVLSFWLPPCVPVVSSAPVSPSPVYDDQNTLLTTKCSHLYATLPLPRLQSYHHEIIYSFCKYYCDKLHLYLSPIMFHIKNYLSFDTLQIHLIKLLGFCWFFMMRLFPRTTNECLKKQKCFHMPSPLSFCKHLRTYVKLHYF